MRLPRLYSPQRKRGSTERGYLFKLYRASSPDVDMRFHYSQSLIVLLCVTAMQAQTITRVWPAEAHPPLRAVKVWNGDTMLAVGLNGALLLSTNAGLSWRAAYAGDTLMSRINLLRSGAFLYSLAIPHGQEFKAPHPQWNRLPELLRYTPSNGRLEILDHPIGALMDSAYVANVASIKLATSEDAVYAFYDNHVAPPTLLLSRDDCRNWTTLRFPDSLDNLQGAHMYAASGGRIFLFMNRHDMPFTGWLALRSGDYGATWSVDSAQGFRFAVDDPPLLWESSRMIVQVQDGRLLASDNDGETWYSLGIPSLATISAWLKSENALFAFCMDGTAHRSTDGGRTWILLQNWYKSPFPNSFRFAAAHGAGTTVVVDNLGNIHRSTDEGLSWDAQRYSALQLRPGRMFDDNIGYVRAWDFEYGEHAYFGTDNGFRSLYPLPRPSEIGFATPLPVSSEFWYAPHSGIGNFDTLVYASNDAGRGWTALLTRDRCPTCIPISVEIESTSMNILLLPTTEGLRASTDQGLNWPIVYSADWSSSDRPLKFVVDETRNEILALPSSLQPLFIVRIHPRTSTVDTLYTITEILYRRTSGITDIMVAENGERIGTAVSLDMDSVTFIGSVDGMNWSIRRKLSVEECWTRDKWFNEIQLLRNRTALLNSRRSDITNITLDIFLSSTDDLQSYEQMFARHFENCFSIPGTMILPGDGNTAYVFSGAEVYRVDNDGVNETSAPIALPGVPRIAALWPQPVGVGNMLQIRLELPQPGPFRLEVLDLLGRLRAVPFDGSSESPVFTTRWSTAALPAGLYILRLLTPHGTSSATLVRR